jgi:hypothetical protein
VGKGARLRHSASKTRVNALHGASKTRVNALVVPTAFDGARGLGGHGARDRACGKA